jgi:hypothetical protein
MRSVTFILNFFVFIIKPTFNSVEETVIFKISNTLILLIFNILIGTIAIYLNLNFLNIQNKLSYQPIPFPLGTTALIVVAMFIGPIIEEMIFRLPLMYSRVNFSIFFSVAIAAVFHDFYKIGFLKHFPYLQIILFAVIIFPILYLILQNHKKTSNFIQGIYTRFNVAILYGFILAFVSFHLFNYKNLTIGTFPIAAASLSGQLFGGLTLSYLRIKYGITYSILLHCLNNFAGYFLISIFLKFA